MSGATATATVRNTAGEEATRVVPIAFDLPPRDPYVSPFHELSIWNRPIGTGAQWGPWLFDPTKVTLNNWMVETHPTWDYSPDDPELPVFKYDKGHYWAHPDTDPNPVDTGIRIRVPEGFSTNRDQAGWTQETPDNAAGWVASDGKTVHEFLYAFVRMGTATDRLLVGLIRGTMDLWGDGLEKARGKAAAGAHGATGLSGLGGVLTEADLFGPDPIGHALQANLYFHGVGLRVGGHNQWCWPAWYADQDTKIYGGDGSPGFNPILRAGALIGIPPEVDVTRLGLKSYPALKLAVALQNYGCYGAEESGSNSWRQCGWCMRWGCVDAGISHGLNFGGQRNRARIDDKGVWFSDSSILFAACRQVVNNSDVPGPSGGGTPLRPYAPPLIPRPT